MAESITVHGMRSKTKSRRRFCEHCQKNLPRTTYFQHRRQYYNKDTGEWCTSNADNSSDSSSDLSCNEPFCLSGGEDDAVMQTHERGSYEGKGQH